MTTKTRKRRGKLTPRQREVVRLIEQGYDTIGIAERVGRSTWTVKDMIRKLCVQLDAPMLDLPKRAREAGML